MHTRPLCSTGSAASYHQPPTLQSLTTRPPLPSQPGAHMCKIPTLLKSRARRLWDADVATRRLGVRVKSPPARACAESRQRSSGTVTRVESPRRIPGPHLTSQESFDNTATPLSCIHKIPHKVSRRVVHTPRDRGHHASRSEGARATPLDRHPNRGHLVPAPSPPARSLLAAARLAPDPTSQSQHTYKHQNAGSQEPMPTMFLTDW